MKQVRKADENFLRWVEMVTPTPAAATQIVNAAPGVDLETILKILLDIFQVLLGLGCFGRARLTSKVKNVLKYIDTQGKTLTALELQKILADVRGF